MRPTRLVLALAAALLWTPTASLAGKVQVLDGPFLFLDRGLAFDKLQSLAKLDQEFGQFCLDGKVSFIDTTTTLNRLITLEYHSLGTIAKQSPTKVQGAFPTLDLTLTVLFGPDLRFPPIFGPVNIDASSLCKLTGFVTKSGAQDHATLVCKLGENLGAFGFPTPPDPGSASILGSIQAAFENRKPVRINVKTGDLLVNHDGETAPPGYGATLFCPTSSDNPG